MLTRFLKNVGCCLSPKASGVVVPTESSDAADGYEFVEVKPSRVLRVRHIIPDRPVVDEPSGQDGSFSFKRKITLTFNGQLLMQNLGDRPHAERRKCDNGDAEANTVKHLDLSDSGNSSPSAGRMKPRRTVIIDCERKILSCKGTHADVTLFFFHGVGGSLDIWGSQLDYFYRQGYEVVAVDLAGHGGSSAPQIAAAYTFYALAEDIRIIFKRYARKRNILIGHSYGVSFCAFLAHEYPELIHKMVLINGGSPTALEPSSCSFFNLPTCVFHCFSPLLRWVFFKGGFAHHGAKEKQLLKDNNAFNVSPFVLHAMMNGQYWPEGDEFYHAEITVPILLVHGLHDKFISVEDEQYMAEILLMAFLKVVEDGSHMVMMECPETINTLLHEFFLWEPITPSPPKKESKTRPETAKAQCDKTTATAEPSTVRPATANQKASKGNG